MTKDEALASMGALPSPGSADKSALVAKTEDGKKSDKDAKTSEAKSVDLWNGSRGVVVRFEKLSDNLMFPVVRFMVRSWSWQAE